MSKKDLINYHIFLTFLMLSSSLFFNGVRETLGFTLVIAAYHFYMMSLNIKNTPDSGDNV